MSRTKRRRKLSMAGINAFSSDLLVDRPLLLGEQDAYGLRCDGGRYDIGHKLDFLRANIELALDREDLGPPLAASMREILQRRGLA